MNLAAHLCFDTYYFIVGVVIDPDYSLYPNKDFQLKWLTIYLEEKAKVQGKVVKQEISCGSGFISSKN